VGANSKREEDMKTYTITLNEWEAAYIGDLIADDLDALESMLDPSVSEVRRQLSITYSFWQDMLAQKEKST
jgi:hypothetical protein